MNPDPPEDDDLEAEKLAAQKQAEIDQLHKQLDAAVAAAEAGKALSKAFEEGNEKESRIAELEEKLKRAGAMESKLRKSLQNKAKETGSAFGRMEEMRRKMAEQDDDDDEYKDDDDDDEGLAPKPAPIHPNLPPSLSAENDEPSDEDE